MDPNQSSHLVYLNGDFVLDPTQRRSQATIIMHTAPMILTDWARYYTEGFREDFGNQGREENPHLMLPEEIAELALFLCTDASSAITGAAIDAFGDTHPLFG